MARPRRPLTTTEDEKVAQQMTQVINIAWGRRLRTSRALIEAVADARENGYTYDGMRVTVWAAACAKTNDRERGPAWIKRELTMNGGLTPDYLLRFKGGQNSETGREAVRWLDVLLSSVDEVNPAMVLGLLERVEKEDTALAADERAMLVRMSMPIGEEPEQL